MQDFNTNNGMVFEIDDYVNPHPNGMGVTFNFVVWQMIRHRIGYFRVNIKKFNNPYREPQRGMNVWDYYFLQDHHNSMQPWPATVEDPIDLPFAGNRDWTVKLQKHVSDFARKHVFLQPELRDKVLNFKDRHFKGKVLGIHLRGTDKIEEYRPMNNIAIVEQVRGLIERLKPDTIFLQTDDIAYWKLMQQFNPVSLDIPRSKKNLHHGVPRGPYQSGEWAVIDGFLGAECNWYAYTPSNFATISIIMGRHEELIRINQNCVIERVCTRVPIALGV